MRIEAGIFTLKMTTYLLGTGENYIIVVHGGWSE